MYFMDALDAARGTNAAAKTMLENIQKTIDEMEFEDKAKKYNLMMWVHYYIDGSISYITFEILMQKLGFEDLLQRQEGEISVGEKGEIYVRNS